MKTFIFTFFITLAICIGYFLYVFIGKESYSPALNPNNTSIHQTIENKQQNTGETKVKICLINSDNKPVITEKAAPENNLENAIKTLLKGTSGSDRLQGAYTEIPQGTKLLSLKDNGSSIAINLSKEFELGGGAQSIQSRLLQLIKTVDMYGENKPVYLYIEGKKIEYLGGEGIYVEQPLNEEALRF